jgi:hypothetical protein
MITERTFPDQVIGGVDISFDDKVGVGGHFDLRLGDTFHQFDLLFPEEAGQHIFVHVLRQWGSRAIGIDGVAAEGNGNGIF